MLDVPFQYIIHSREHQQAVARLIRGLGNWFEKTGKPEWEALPALKLDEAHTSPVPDVVICRNELPVAVIELTSKSAVRVEAKKLTRLLEESEFLKEGFLFDYASKTWRKFDSETGEVVETPSFCETIGYDLAQFVN